MDSAGPRLRARLTLAPWRGQARDRRIAASEVLTVPLIRCRSRIPRGPGKAIGPAADSSMTAPSSERTGVPRRPSIRQRRLSSSGLPAEENGATTHHDRGGVDREVPRDASSMDRAEVASLLLQLVRWPRGAARMRNSRGTSRKVPDAGKASRSRHLFPPPRTRAARRRLQIGGHGPIQPSSSLPACSTVTRPRRPGAAFSRRNGRSDSISYP